MKPDYSLYLVLDRITSYNVCYTKLLRIPEPLEVGKLELVDGRWVSGFICEPQGIKGATDITATGGWRYYIAEQRVPS